MYSSIWCLLVMLTGNLMHHVLFVRCWRHNHSSPAAAATAPVSNAQTHSYSCRGCAEARDLFAKIRIEQIKREILEKLGLDTPPKVRPAEGFPSIPQVAKYLRSHVRRDIHSSFLTDDPTYYYASNQEQQQKTEQTIIFAERAPSAYNQNLLLAYFRFSREIMSKSLRRAFLYVFIRKPTNLHAASRIGTVQVIVREVLRDGKVSESDWFLLHSSIDILSFTDKCPNSLLVRCT
ncbi:unnamed protein product [Anisakis simplex]|uniref:TGF-beta propeptide domain-containing protein n=1 Tax=Anisakis simplex TaxID=6269 RepID=A0A0M3K0R4_ANISI|nr:unnamed protein product [Anisakis simplex]